MFLHRLPDESAVYRQLSIAGGQEVKLTDKHLIYATNCQIGEVMRLHHASDLRVGQCVYMSVSSMTGTVLRSSKITNITEVVFLPHIYTEFHRVGH